MSRDGLVPERMGSVGKRRTPVFTTIVFAVLVAIIAALVPLTTIAELVNIGTPVRVLPREHRRDDPAPDAAGPRPRLQGARRVAVRAPIGATLCIYLMAKQPFDTWMRFFVWMAIGLVIYFFYSRKHSKLRQGLAGGRPPRPPLSGSGAGRRCTAFSAAAG
jgi:APA family basic amino acid/polyamine antiporter